jgi:outer membrane protein assembly factor BamB
MKKVIIGFIALFIISACNNNNEWSRFRGNLGNTGRYEGKAPVELTNIKWKFKTEGDVMSSPAVADGIVFFGSEDNYLYAVDIKTGQEKWKFKTGNNVQSSPAVAEGIVFFGSMDNYLYAVNIKTGQEKWKFKTENDIYPSPAVAEGIVFFGSWDNYLLCCK